MWLGKDSSWSVPAGVLGVVLVADALLLGGRSGGGRGGLRGARCGSGAARPHPFFAVTWASRQAWISNDQRTDALTSSGAAAMVRAAATSHRGVARFLRRLEQGNVVRHPGFRADMAEHAEVIGPRMAPLAV